MGWGWGGIGENNGMGKTRNLLKSYQGNISYKDTQNKGQKKART